MSLDEDNDALSGKKIRFKTPARVLFATESKIDDLLRNDKETTEVDHAKKGKYLNTLFAIR
jgi:hypothetical protein